MATLPPLPQIVGDVDLLLDVYTHKSLIPSGAPMNEEYGDTDRLADLGARILDLIVTLHFYSRKPMLPISEINQRRAQATTDQNVETWLNAYGIRQRLRFAPSERDSVGSPDELRRLFHTYIGALYIRAGMHTIQQWIAQLIDIDAEPLVSEPPQPHDSGLAPPPPGSPSPLSGYSTNAPSGSAPNPLAVTLALVNETAAKKKVTVTYPAESVGDSHQPMWTVRCCIDGTEQGRGVGKSQKVAKEEAARGAWANMGWPGDRDLGK